MDDADRAQERQAAANAESLAKQSRQAQLDLPGNEICADCGEPIPEERRRALPSAHRCVGCQAFAERVEQMRMRRSA